MTDLKRASYGLRRRIHDQLYNLKKAQEPLRLKIQSLNQELEASNNVIHEIETFLKLLNSETVPENNAEGACKDCDHYDTEDKALFCDLTGDYKEPNETCPEWEPYNERKKWTCRMTDCEEPLCGSSDLVCAEHWNKRVTLAVSHEMKCSCGHVFHPVMVASPRNELLCPNCDRIVAQVVGGFEFVWEPDVSIL